MTDYTNSMSKKFDWDDFFSDDTIVDPSTMSYEMRFEFINGILEDYTYYKNKGSVHKDPYAKLLASLIKRYGH